VPAPARGSIADTLALGPAFVEVARRAFTDGMQITMIAGLVGAAAGALVARLLLPRGRVGAEPDRPREPAAAEAAEV
jgi:DHA2 family multidrug resistance protein-like MFS transporter